MYSKEEGTPAGKMKNQISKKIKTDRYNKLMELQEKIIEKNNKNRIGNTYETLVEGVDEDGIFYKGRTYCESPDIDPIIYFTSEEPLEIYSLVDVKIINNDKIDLVGVVVNESTK